ncbi:MAG: sulfatase-like hydrolase/transferase [Alphaproteobacteria bacterium]|nr:sulfatase-like hydrolase/transferase [Alphaproteobacteria bacterium]
MRGKARKPNLIVILIDDLRFDEVGICGHPYMKTPHIDRIGREGARFVNAFHPTPLCSPNRASIVTGQYASRHGIIDNVARDAHSHRLPNYHGILQTLGYETAHIGKWHMGNSADPRPGYDTWVSFPGHGTILDPVLNENGRETKYTGYITDLLNERAVAFLSQPRRRPFALFLAHKAVHPDAYQAPDGTIDLSRGGYRAAERHRDLYRGERFPRRPNAVALDVAVRGKPAFREAFQLKRSEKSQALLAGIQAGTDEEIRLRAAMMASVDEGVGDILATLERTGQLDDTLILFLGDNGYFFGEHGLGPERRFAYEEGIKSPFLVRYPAMFAAGEVRSELVLTIDIAPTLVDLAGGTPGQRVHMQGRSLCELVRHRGGRRRPWRDAFMCEYFSENAMPWLVGMSYKAVRTRRYKYIHWTQQSLDGVACDELYDLAADPYEMSNLISRRAHRATVARLRRRLARLVAESVGL